MAEYEHRDNSFSAFYNREKRNDRSPDFSGKLKINGELYFIDMWEKDIQRGDNAGDRMFSGTVKKMESRGGGSSRGESSRGESSHGGGRDDRRDGGRDSGYQRGRDEERSRDQGGGRSGGGHGGFAGGIADDSDIPFAPSRI